MYPLGGKPLLRAAIVVPCYNEAGRMPVATFAAEIEARPDWSWIFVNSGSVDTTEQVIRRLTRELPNAQALMLRDNAG